MSIVFQLNDPMSMDICTALQRGYFALVRFLLDLGADVNHKDDQGRTPLILCALIDEPRWALGIAQTLLEKSARVGLRDRYGLNPLHYACLYECQDLVNLLLQAVDYDLNQGDRLGHSALFYAVNSGSADVVRIMVDNLTKYGVPVDKANKFGVTPLMQAYKTKRFDLADVLIHEGCADEEMRDIDGKSAREMANDYRHIYETEQRLGIRRARSALKRVKSAPPRRLRKVIDDEEAEKKVVTLPMTKSTNKLLRLCKDCDLRNDPYYMFRLTPVDCFATQPALRVSNHEPRHRPVTAGGNSTSWRGQLRPVTAGGNGTWRGELRYLYKHLEVKHTESFRDTIAIPRSHSMSTDVLDGAGHGLRIPGSDRMLERRGSAMSSKGSLASTKQKLRDVERLLTNPLIKSRRGSNQSPTGQHKSGKATRDDVSEIGKRPTSRQAHHQIPLVKEP